jgi:hypothetical protein
MMGPPHPPVKQFPILDPACHLSEQIDTRSIPAACNISPVDMEFNSLRSNPKYLYWLDVLGLPSAVRTQDLRN